VAVGISEFIALGDARNRRMQSAALLEQMPTQRRRAELENERLQQMMEQSSSLFPDQRDLLGLQVAGEKRQAEMREKLYPSILEFFDATQRAEDGQMRVDNELMGAFERLEQEFNVPIPPRDRQRAREDFMLMMSSGMGMDGQSVTDPITAFRQAVSGIDGGSLDEAPGPLGSGAAEAMRLAFEADEAAQAKEGSAVTEAEDGLDDLLAVLARSGPGGAVAARQIIEGLGADPGLDELRQAATSPALRDLGALRGLAPAVTGSVDTLVEFLRSGQGAGQAYSAPDTLSSERQLQLRMGGL